MICECVCVCSRFFVWSEVRKPEGLKSRFFVFHKGIKCVDFHQFSPLCLKVNGSKVNGHAKDKTAFKCAKIMHFKDVGNEMRWPRLIFISEKNRLLTSARWCHFVLGSWK